MCLFHSEKKLYIIFFSQTKGKDKGRECITMVTCRKEKLCELFCLLIESYEALS